MKRVRKIVFGALAVLLLVFLFGFFGFPHILSSQYNVVKRDKNRTPVSERAKELHRTLRVVDLHCDALLNPRDLNRRSTGGHVDVPRMQEGNMILQAFTVVTQAPAGMNEESTDPNDLDLITIQSMASLWPTRTWQDNLQRALYQSEKLHRFAKKSGGDLRIIKTKEDLQSLVKDHGADPTQVGGLLGLEGFHVGELSAVDAMYDAGFRMMAPTHFFDSYMGGSAHGVDKGGLTKFGYDVINRMQELNIALDLSHASITLLDDVFRDFPDIPKIISHTGVKGTCDRRRNMSDEHLKGIAACGGVVGIGFWPSATCGETVKEIADAIDYTVKLLGVDHVGLGSDFDGMVQTPFDVSDIDQITEELLTRGYPDEDIAKIMGDNTINFFLRVLPSEE